MPRNNPKYKWRPVRLTMLLIALYGLQSCNSEILAPISPETDSEAEQTYFTTVRPIGKKSDPVWLDVVTEVVEPGNKTKIRGSRYTLEFDGDEIDAPMTVTIRERDSGIVDVSLEGSTLLAPVTLEINYAGTKNDPLNSENKGTPLTVFEKRNSMWIPVPGEPRAGKSKTRVMDVTALSRFAMWDGVDGPRTGHSPSPKRPRENVRTP